MYHEWPYGQWRQIAAATPVSFNSIRNVAAMILSPCHVSDITRAVEWYPSDMSSRPSENERRDLLKQQALPCVVFLYNVVDSSAPLHSAKA